MAAKRKEDLEWQRCGEPATVKVTYKYKGNVVHAFVCTIEHADAFDNVITSTHPYKFKGECEVSFRGIELSVNQNA